MLFLQAAWRRLVETGGVLTGKWKQRVYACDPEGRWSVVKEDCVWCRQKGELVRADIRRQIPVGETRRKWHFSGRFREGVLFGHFWSKDPRYPSFGTIFLRQTDPKRFSGFYIRLTKVIQSWGTDHVQIERVPLEWLED